MHVWCLATYQWLEGVCLKAITNQSLSLSLSLSPSQRLHNAEVALTCLRHYMAVPEGASETVVDGHREKTLALLWSIIFHFKVRRQYSSVDVQCTCIYISVTCACTRVCAHACMYFVRVYVHVHVCILVSCCLATKISKAHISKLKW